MSCLDFQPRTKHKRSGRVSSVAAGDSGLFLGADGREREREGGRIQVGAPKESRPIFHYECFDCSSLPRAVVR